MQVDRRRMATVIGIIGLVCASLTFAPAGPAGAQAKPGRQVDRTKLSGKALRASGRQTVAKSATSRLARSDRGLLDRTDARPVPVVVKYDYDSIATYRGQAGGPRATSPSATGRPLTEQEARSGAYAQVVARREASISGAIRRAVPAARIGRSLRVVYGGVAMVVPANQAKALLKVAGVVAVQEDSLAKPLTDSSPGFVDAPPVWDAVGGQSTAGAGVVFADLDTGVWPEHPSFAANPDLPARPTRPGGGDIGCDFGDNPLTPATDVFACTNKLAGGYSFLDTYNSIHDDETFPDTARDSDGHGTHTTSTSAGDIVDHANPLGVDRGTISGLAPGAAVVEYKVCGLSGCFASDSADAVGQTILDGADVINFSISGGTDPLSDPVELAFLDAYDSGVFVSASAGNDGPTAGTVNHLSPWVTSVAASTQSRAFESQLSLTGDDAATLTLSGASITTGIDTPTPVVLASAAPYGDALCQADPTTSDAIPDDVFDGKIVACERGGNARIEKGYNVKQGGAVGMILYNPDLADTETDNHWLPAVHLADGHDFEAFVADHGPVTATFTAGQKTTGKGDVMASFSSRGPAGAFIKPDITAPGVQILAGNTPVPDAVDLGPPGQYYQAIAGTSMSSPHVAGAGILLKAAHPTWTPGQIRSALMMTAITNVVKEDETTPADPFDMGAGRIDIAHASASGLTLDESAEQFQDLTGTLGAIDLNIASVDAPIMPGEVTTSRTFTNVGAGTATYQVSASAPAGSSITVSPSSFSISAGSTRTVQITIRSSRHDAEQQFGQVVLTAPGRTTLHLPVAWVPTQGAISATSSCADATVAFQASTTCDVSVRNDSFAQTTAGVHAAVNDHLQITAAGPDATHTATAADASGVDLAGREPGVPSLQDADGFDGYLELAGTFVESPDPIGDEEFLSYTGFGSFVYNGQSYDEVNVNSNGYLVAGPASSADDVCCPPQHSPDAAPPNNVIAPFWSDLGGDSDTPAGEPDLGVYAAVLTDTGTGQSWMVIESRLLDCCASDASHGTTKVSQVWLGLNGDQDITIDYPPEAIPDTSGIEQAPGDPLALVGVQNELGDGAEVDPTATPLPTDFFVTSTDPVPGDTYTMHLGVKGVRGGAGVVTSSVTSPDVLGTTIVNSAIAVGEPPLSGVDAFVARAFQDFLGRAPTSGELAHDRKALDDGSLTRRAFVLRLARSDEYLGHEVDARYEEILDRASDPAGRAYWIGKLRSGLSDVGLVSSLLSSNESFTKSGGTVPGYADHAYQVVLDRLPTTAERQAFVDRIEGGTSRAGAARLLYQTAESRRRRVTGLYLRLLHRTPDPSGLAYWSRVILTKGDIALAVNLATSNEYFNRTR
ncbi:MAG: peptidase and in kexin sedolisin [Acidimicrobiales bacterium]|nr:peptidase and in kexin sedolisin [Acidimicrobiales bacterium]